MNQAQRSCATCSVFDPVRECWISASGAEQGDTPQAGRPSLGPDDCCENHQTQLESEALDAALYDLCQPLLIKSRWSATRNKDRRDMQ